MPRTNIIDSRNALLEDLLSARQAVLQVVLDLPTERLDEIFLGEWSVKDLLAHLSGWDVANLQAVQEILAGQYPTFFQYYDKDWRSYNARLVKMYKIEPFNALMAEVESSHQALISLLVTLSPDAIMNGKAKSPRGRTVTIRNLLRAETSDERQHAEQVRAWFGLSGE